MTYPLSASATGVLLIPSTRTTRSAWLLALVLALGISGCGDETTAPKRPALRLEKISPDSQVFVFGSPPKLSPTVRVTDLKGNPVAGVSVQVSSPEYEWLPSVVSNGEGIAKVEWKPLWAQINTLWMGIDDVDPVRFTATGRCIAQQTIQLGVPVTGTLAAGDCATFCLNYCWGGLFDEFIFENASEMTVRMQATGDPSLALFDSRSRRLAWSIYDGSGAAAPAVLAIIPAGSYRVSVSDAFTLDSYELTINGPVADPGCRRRFIVRGVTTAQSLNSLDCVDQGRYVDSFVIQLHVGDTVTVTLASAEFETVLKVEREGYADYTRPPPVTTISGKPSAPAALPAYCDTGVACIYRIVTSSKAAAVTGSYTLSIP